MTENQNVREEQKHPTLQNHNTGSQHNQSNQQRNEIISSEYMSDDDELEEEVDELEVEGELAELDEDELDEKDEDQFENAEVDAKGLVNKGKSKLKDGYNKFVEADHHSDYLPKA